MDESSAKQSRLPWLIKFSTFHPPSVLLIKVWRPHSAVHSLQIVWISFYCHIQQPLVTFRCPPPSFGAWVSNVKLMNAVGVLDGGFVTAAEAVMEHRLSLNVTLLSPNKDHCGGLSGRREVSRCSRWGSYSIWAIICTWKCIHLQVMPACKCMEEVTAPQVHHIRQFVFCSVFLLA